MRRHFTLGLEGWLVILLTGVSMPVFAKGLPPAWQTDNTELLTDEPITRGKKKRSERPWYEPRVAIGLGLNVPELLPFEGYLFFGKFFALRLFYTPPLPFNIRIEMPSDLISTKKGVGVANPEFTIRMKATYGAHYGLEALTFPMGGSFFVGAGMSRRQMRLVGDAKSPILVCSLIEAAKEPPCGDPAARIETKTEIELNADVTTTAILMRAGFGWFWHVGDFGYIMFNAGASRPTKVTRDVKVSANLDSPAGTDAEVTGALAQVKAEREADLKDKAVREMRPTDEKLLPILGLAAGIRF